MSILGRPVKLRAVVGGVIGIIALVAFLPALSTERAHEVRLEARNMAFYLEGGDVPNPVIEVERGQSVRIVLRNRERGMTHDFAVPAIDAALDAIDWNEEETVVFTAPERAGEYEYVCRPHTPMMKGTLRVR